MLKSFKRQTDSQTDIRSLSFSLQYSKLWDLPQGSPQLPTSMQVVSMLVFYMQKMVNFHIANVFVGLYIYD